MGQSLSIMVAAWALLLAALGVLLWAWRAPDRRPAAVALGWLLLLTAIWAWCRWHGWEVGLASAIMWLSPLAWALVLTQAEQRQRRSAPARVAGEEPGPGIAVRVWQLLGAGPLAFVASAAWFAVGFFHLPLPLPVDRAIVSALIVLMGWATLTTWVMLCSRPQRACVWIGLAGVVGLGAAVILAPAGLQALS